MQQFGPQFINNHLMPLLEEMLEDTVQREKDYLDKLFINGVLEDTEKKNLMDFYFSPSRKNAGVPFVGPEEKKDRENLLKHFVEYIRSRGAKPEDRIRAFLPVVDEKSTGAVKTVKWPADVKRNLFLLSYHIAENFEKDQINELIAARAATGKPEDVEQAKKDEELLKKGMLILVRDPATGEFTKYIRATELKEGDTAVQFLPPPSPEVAKVMERGFTIPSDQIRAAVAKSGASAVSVETFAQGGVSPLAGVGASTYEQKPVGDLPDKVSSSDELTKSFQQRRGKAIVNHLTKLGFTPQDDVQFDANGHAMVKVKSGNDTLLVSVDTRVPFDQDLKFTMTFQTGTHAGKSMTIEESKLDEAFQKAGGGLRTAGELYEDVDLSKKLGIKSDAYPEKAPGAPQPVPMVGVPKTPGEKVPFKIPQVEGGLPMPMEMALEMREREEKGPEKGGKLPPEAKAPPMPKAPEETRERAVGTKIKMKPVPGVPAGSVMEKKIAVAAKGQPQEGALAAGVPSAPPVAPGRIEAVTGAVSKPKKSNFGKIVLVSNLAGVGSTLGGVWGLSSMGGSSVPDSVSTAWKIVKSVLIALTNHLPHLFG